MTKSDHVRGFVLLASCAMTTAFVADALGPSFMAVMAALFAFAMFCGACVALFKVLFHEESGV